eukprot:CAMPEP_0195104814 /NCGR_PEP_ID=MMETSP0448-20130528/73902_1 /TAXON_ID=66468 /ORGANISM="Heterocapsa triquestra, Strain CCMP 448" /LENGTH=81 /DNA_ID=CAMNT_0040140731 /DNA_START=14 /DNA_END=256 /DNA_ORIENTATION=+
MGSMGWLAAPAGQMPTTLALRRGILHRQHTRVEFCSAASPWRSCFCCGRSPVERPSIQGMRSASIALLRSSRKQMAHVPSP